MRIGEQFLKDIETARGEIKILILNGKWKKRVGTQSPLLYKKASLQRHRMEDCKHRWP